MNFLKVCRFSLLFFSLFGGLFPAETKAHKTAAGLFTADFALFDTEHADFWFADSIRPVEKIEVGGIKEIVPAKFQPRYRKWKNELLITEFGRQQWEYYSNNRQFSLIVVVSSDKEFAAKTGDYKWNERGELVGATITLGKHLDKGYPNAIYYPVMNSLSLSIPPYEISGDILAATKLAHEIGHVNVTAQTDGTVFEQQNRLIASYYKIFLKNGYDASDPRLIQLATELGALPMQIWAEREYRGEANAMRYLNERAGNEKFYCSIFNQIKRNINDYAKNHEEAFAQLLETTPATVCQN